MLWNAWTPTERCCCCCFRIVNFVQNETLSNFSITVQPSGGVSSAECTSDQFEVSDFLYGEVSEFKNLTLGKYVCIIGHLVSTVIIFVITL